MYQDHRTVRRAMWMPVRIFTAFRQQCLRKIALIESFLNEIVVTRRRNGGQAWRPGNAWQKMTSAWTRHLVQVQEWQLRMGQQELSKDLLQMIAETNWQVDECFEVSRYIYQWISVHQNTDNCSPGRCKQDPTFAGMLHRGRPPSKCAGSSLYDDEGWMPKHRRKYPKLHYYHTRGREQPQGHPNHARQCYVPQRFATGTAKYWR